MGLSGWAGSGKDTTADILVEMHGFTKISFADPLRDFLYAQNCTVRMDGREEYWTVKRIIDDYGWQGYKNSPFSNTLRKLIQVTGTEAGREQIDMNVWVNAAVNRAKKAGDVVFSDVRFFNEAFAVQSLGGEIWRVDRAGVGPANDHPSERELDEYPFNRRIQNDGDIENLVDQVSHYLSS